MTCFSTSADATATEKLKPLHIRHPSAGVGVLRLTALECGLHRAISGMKKNKKKKKKRLNTDFAYLKKVFQAFKRGY